MEARRAEAARGARCARGRLAGGGDGGGGGAVVVARRHRRRHRHHHATPQPIDARSGRTSRTRTPVLRRTRGTRRSAAAAAADCLGDPAAGRAAGRRFRSLCFSAAGEAPQGCDCRARGVSRAQGSKGSEVACLDRHCLVPVDRWAERGEDRRRANGGASRARCRLRVSRGGGAAALISSLAPACPPLTQTHAFTRARHLTHANNNKPSPSLSRARNETRRATDLSSRDDRHRSSRTRARTTPRQPNTATPCRTRTS